MKSLLPLTLFMCGRFALNRGLGELRARLNIHRVVENGRTFAPSNNIAPGAVAPVVAGNELRVLNWGTSIHEKTVFNARSEKVVTTFKSDVSQRRCVVPADGYFEWNKQRQPFFFRTGENTLMFLAGFYTKGGDFVILTRAGSNQVSAIHERMPIILTLEQIEDWIGEKWMAVLGYVPPVLSFYAVSRHALGSGYTGEECIKPIKNKSNTQRTLEDLLKPKLAIK